MAKEVLFLPGYYGSHLFNGTKKKFLGLSQILPLSQAPSLDDWPHLDTEILNTAGVGPIQLSVYQKPLELLESAGFKVSAFSYDWRKSIRLSARLLLDHLETCSKKQVLIGHSMGGLVILSALIQAKESRQKKALSNIAGAVYVATPFKGLPVLFRNFLIGTPFFYNPRYLMPETLNTYDSPFEMLPDFVPIKTVDGIIKLDTTDPSQWEPHLRQFNSSVLGDHRFKTKIKKAKEFRKHLLSASSMNWDFPMKVIQSNGKKTPSMYEILSSGQLQLDHWHLGPFMFPRSKFHWEDGDRTVLLDSQFFPEGPQHYLDTQTYKAGHLEILEHPKMHQDLNNWLTS